MASSCWEHRRKIPPSKRQQGNPSKHSPWDQSRHHELQFALNGITTWVPLLVRIRHLQNLQLNTILKQVSDHIPSGQQTLCGWSHLDSVLASAKGRTQNPKTQAMLKATQLKCIQPDWNADSQKSKFPVTHRHFIFKKRKCYPCLPCRKMVPNPLPEEACQPSQASNDKVSFTCALECERPSFREDTFLHAIYL